MVSSLVWQIPSINLWGLPPPPHHQTLTIMNSKSKKNQVESEAEKLSPQDKAPQTDNQNNSVKMDIEITEVTP